jgi:uncharacterized protein (DUF488 family)
MIRTIFAIGVYGFDEASFLAALTKARVDLLIDVRARRGVRGHEYAFANARRLMAALAARGLPYVHAPELAPSDETRAIQYAADDRAHVGQRRRTQASAGFRDSYTRTRLRGFDVERFIAERCGAARRPALLCVEAEPAACHRLLAAEYLAAALDVPVRHLRPPAPVPA